jgi:hypothetical protein
VDHKDSDQKDWGRKDLNYKDALQEENHIAHVRAEENCVSVDRIDDHTGQRQAHNVHHAVDPVVLDSGTASAEYAAEHVAEYVVDHAVDRVRGVAAGSESRSAEYSDLDPRLVDRLDTCLEAVLASLLAFPNYLHKPAPAFLRKYCHLYRG